MTTEAPRVKRPVWRAHHTVASVLLVVGVFAATVFGAGAGSTISRAAEQSLTVKQLVVAADVSYLLTVEGELYSQGLNNFGQLGIGSVTSTSNWSRVDFTDEGDEPLIEKLATEGEHVVALDSTGSIWTWGSSQDAALGSGSRNPGLRPSKLSVAYSFSQLQAGDDFIVALDSRGVVYTWGQNSQGQLGNGTKDPVAGPSIVSSDSRFSSITAGSNFALAIDSSGGLWGWGANDSGQLGDGSKTSALMPKLIGGGPWASVNASRFSDTVVGIDQAGKLWAWGSGSNALLGVGRDWRAEQVAENKRVTDEIARVKAEDVAARQAITDERNLARVAELTPIWEAAEASWLTANQEPDELDFPIAIDPDGELFIEALAEWEELRSAWLTANPKPTVANLSTVDKAAVEAQVVELWKATDVSGFTPAVISEPALSGESLTPARLPTEASFTRVSLGSENAFALDSSGNLWAWGNDKNGQTGLGLDESTYTHQPVKVSSVRYSDVFAGDKWAVAAGSGLHTWGLNSSNNILQSSEAKLTSPTMINEGTYTGLSGGRSTVAATQTDGATVTWGSNTAGLAGQNAEGGNLGLGLIEGRFREVAFTDAGALALGFSAGRLYFWGSDASEISASGERIEEDVLAPRAHIIANFVDIAAGRLSTHVVDANGFLWTWGAAWMGALAFPSKVIGAPTPVPTGAKATMVTASRTDVMFLTAQNELRWWGSNSEGGNITQVTVPEELELGEIVAIEAGQNHFVILDDTGAVFSVSTTWSLAQLEGQTPGVLTPIELPGPAQAIAAGWLGSLAVVEGVAYGWGDNIEAPINPSDETGFVGAPAKLPTPLDGAWSLIDLSSTHLLGVSNKGVLYGWGQSKYIEGLGNLTKSVKPLRVTISVESE